MWRRGRREGKGRANRAAWCGEGRRRDGALIAKGGSRTVGTGEKRGEGGGRVDYLRLIWIVDYSGPRGAAWPRVSISEPLARAHLRLPLLLCCLRSSSRTRPALPNLSQTSTRASPLSPFLSLFLFCSPLLSRFLTGSPLASDLAVPSRGEKFVRSD